MSPASEELQDLRHPSWALLVPIGLRWEWIQLVQAWEAAAGGKNGEMEGRVGVPFSVAWQGCGRDGVEGSLLLEQGNELKCQHRAFCELLSRRGSCRNNWGSEISGFPGWGELGFSVASRQPLIAPLSWMTGYTTPWPMGCPSPQTVSGMN